MKLTFTLAYYKVPKCQLGRANKLLATKKPPKKCTDGIRHRQEMASIWNQRLRDTNSESCIDSVVRNIPRITTKQSTFFLFSKIDF